MKSNLTLLCVNKLKLVTKTGGELEPSAVTSLKPCTDWSRKTRNQIALLKLGSDPHQTKITSFFHVIEKITELTDAEPKYNTIIQASEEQRVLQVLVLYLISF